jgi:hypothetical protein
MSAWKYHITVHSADDILAELTQSVDTVPHMIFCDDEGACFFDEGPNPLTQAIEAVLNEEGAKGWELVHIAFRPHQIICFWKRPG